MKALGLFPILLLVPAASFSLAAANESSPDIDSLALTMRDPFKRPFSAAQTPAAPVPELERYGVDQFKLIGVITGADRTRAILMDPDGKSHFVSEKMRIGTRKGLIREIRSDVVFVRERAPNVIGQEEVFDSEIRLPAEGVVPSESGTQPQEQQQGQ